MAHHLLPCSRTVLKSQKWQKWFQQVEKRKEKPKRGRKSQHKYCWFQRRNSLHSINSCGHSEVGHNLLTISWNIIAGQIRRNNFRKPLLFFHSFFPPSIPITINVCVCVCGCVASARACLCRRAAVLLESVSVSYSILVVFQTDKKKYFIANIRRGSIHYFIFPHVMKHSWDF